MRGGTSSALISGYSTFLRLRSEARCCRREIFFARRVRTRERRAAMETMRVTTERGGTKRRSAVGRTGRTLEPRHIARAVVGAGSLEPHARWKSPCAASGGASAPPRLQVSGFWRSIRTTHLLGPGFGVALGGLGVDVRRRANNEAHGGTDHDSHVSVCGVARRGAARSEGATDADRDNRHRKRQKRTRRRGPLFGRAGGVCASGRFHSKMHELKRMKKRRLLAIHRIG